MPTRRRSVVLIATLVVVGVLWVVAPSASASPATAGTLDTPGSIARAGSVSAAQPAAPPPERWNRTYGSEAGDLTAVTSDGRGVVAAGTMLTSSGTSSSGWVVAVDAAGDVRFQDTYATDGDGRIEDIVPTADGGYLLAGALDSGNTAAEDGWVLKIDATGSEVWQRTLGGAGDDAFTAIQPADDGYLLAGTKGSGSDSDGWLVKVTAGGDVRWDGSYDNDFDDRVRDIAPHPAGGYLLAGETTAFVGARTDGWTVHVEADGSELQQRTYGGARTDGFRAVETLGGDLLLAGESNTYGTSNRRGWVLRRGPNGTERWNRTYEVDGTDGLATTDDGFVLAGIQTTDAGTRDGVIVGAGPEGTTAWRRAYGGANDDLFSDVLVGADGGYLLAGTSYSGPGDSTGWLVTLGTVRQQSTPTVTPTTTAPPTTGDTSGTQTAGSSGSTGDGGTARAAAGGQSPIETAGPVDGSTTTTNASAAGGGGSFPWTLVALFLIVVVLGGVFLAIRSQQVGGAFGSGGEEDHEPSPPGDSDPTFGTPSGESQDGTPTAPSQTNHGTPRDPDPLGTNARTPGEAAKLFLASVATWVRLRAPFLDDPRPAESAVSTAGTGENAGPGGTVSPETGADRQVDTSNDQSPSTAADTDPGGDLAESTTADVSDSDSSGEGTVAAEGGAGSSVASGDAQAAESASGSAAAGAATPAGGGDPGNFTLRNPGEQEVVVAFRCQTVDETLFNYYAELPPSTIKRARKLPAERPFEITVAITDGPSETRLFQNDGPNGQDVTVTIAPDTIDMVGESEQETDAAVQGTVEPGPSESDQSINAPGDRDSQPAQTERGQTEVEEAGESSDITGDGDAAVSDDPSDVLPSADDATDDTVVADDPGDVLPSASDDGGPDDADAGSTADSEQPETGAAATGADESDDVADDDNHDVTDVSDDAAESESSGGSGFQALKEEFESGDADWADEESDETADDGSDDPFAGSDDDLGDDFDDGLDDDLDDDLGGDLDDDLGESFDDELDDDFDDELDDDFDDDFDDMGDDLDDSVDESDAGSDEADESGSDDSGGSDGDKSFAELKDEFESGDADWADEDDS